MMYILKFSNSSVVKKRCCDLKFLYREENPTKNIALCTIVNVIGTQITKRNFSHGTHYILPDDKVIFTEPPVKITEAFSNNVPSGYLSSRLT